MSIKLEHALRYAARGWKVFPCAVNSKVPMAGTHGVKDATGDTNKITEWWTNTPDANIGLACGSTSGVWVVDIDIRPDTGVNGFDSITAAGLSIYDTRKQTTPSGGMHFLYKCDGEKPANKNGFLKGVDIRGDGYYIVVAPSVVGGREYRWENEDAPLAEFPSCFKAKKELFSFSSPIIHSTGMSSIDRARAYLAEIDGAVQGQGGHNTLFWVAQVLINGFNLSDAEAEMLMWDDFNPRCTPPWKRTVATEKEFRHKIEEAHRHPNASACAIRNEEPEIDVSNFDFDACIADVRALLYPQEKKNGTANTGTVKQNEVLNDLLYPDGLVGDISRWITDTAGCKQPLFSLGAALVLCGAVFGRKVEDESHGRTNLYAIGVGHSSSGKDHPGDCIAKILTMAGANDLLMGRMTSDTAIEKALVRSQVKLAVIDEVGHFFSNINSAGENSSYLKTIKPCLMELFSSAHKLYLGKEKADGTAAKIAQPCMCIWGVTAPQKLYSGITIEELQDGWIARNLMFVSDARPQYVIPPNITIPDDIINTIRAWISRVPQQTIISSIPGENFVPMKIPMDASARAIFEKYAVKTHDLMIQCNKDNDKTEYLWGKALQNARRIALIIACGKEFEMPVIGRYEAEYGCRLVEFLVRDLSQRIKDHVSENKNEDRLHRVMSIIKSAGEDGINHSILTRKTQWIGVKRMRQDVIDDLLDSGLIVVDKRGFGHKCGSFVAEFCRNSA